MNTYDHKNDLLATKMFLSIKMGDLFKFPMDLIQFNLTKY